MRNDRGLAPFGYVNITEDRDEPIQPHPENAKAVVRLFELYASGDHTLESIGDTLADEGFVFRPSAPRFHRTAVSYILNNRFYIGEIRQGANLYQGRHQPLIDRSTFQTCQDRLQRKTRRTKAKVNLPLSSELFTCDHCGAMITGERIKAESSRFADPKVLAPDKRFDIVEPDDGCFYFVRWRLFSRIGPQRPSSSSR